MITSVDVEEARERIRNQIYLSPFPYSESISRLTGTRAYFKLENLQMTGSFKERGALNRLLTLNPDEASRGVIAASAGNHGMAVAFHSQRLHISATIVMPLHAPLIKVSQVRRYGAQTVLHGTDYDAAFAEAYRLAKQKGLSFIHAFDDPWVIAGQGTIGLELYEQNPDLNAVLVPVGGGGLIGGIALVLKTLNPTIRVIGVQAEAAPSMKAALQQGAPIRVPPAATMADGIAVREVGETTFALARKYVDEVVTVSEGEIANAVLLLLETEKMVAEAAAAVSLAALVSKKVALAGRNVGLIISGGNIDMNLISRIIEKGLIQDGRLCRLSVVLSDRPGMLARLSQRVGDLGANILHIAHNRGFGQIAIGETDPEHIERVDRALRTEGFRVKIEN
jgi:threonine dehydratase